MGDREPRVTNEKAQEAIRLRFESNYRGNKQELLKGFKGEKRHDASDWLRDEPGYSLYIPAPHGLGTYKRLRTIASGVDTHWQADLTDFKDYMKENGGIRYLLTVLDLYSRWSMGEPVRTKGAQDMKLAFTTLINREGRKPIKLLNNTLSNFIIHKMKRLKHQW